MRRNREVAASVGYLAILTPKGNYWDSTPSGFDVFST
jgi:hypothetical protein